jgi:hypothetical protein
MLERSFTGSLVQPLVQPTGSQVLLPYPNTTIGGTESFTMDARYSNNGSIQVNVLNVSAAANTKSAPYAVAATGAIQTTLTWTAVVNANGQGSLGNNITVALIGGGTAGAETVTVTGNAIVAKIQSGTSTFTQVRTALNNSTAAAALATFVGTSGSAMTRTGTLASKVTQGLTLTAVDDPNGVDTNGNNITLTITGGATAGSEVVTVVGNAITVQVQSGVSTVTQVRTAMQASTPCTALVTTTGTSSSTVATASAVSLTGGVTGVTATSGGVDSVFAAGIIAGNSLITISSHSLWNGEVIRTPATSGTLATGLVAATNYYVYISSSSTFQLFDTLAHANLAAALYNSNGPAPSTATGLIAITADGSVGGSTLLTPVSLSGCSYQIQGSNDYVPAPNVVGAGGSNIVVGASSGVPTALYAGNWIELATGQSPTGVVSNNVTTTGSSSLVYWEAGFAYVRIVFATSAGTAQIQVIGHS